MLSFQKLSHQKEMKIRICSVSCCLLGRKTQFYDQKGKREVTQISVSES